MCKILIYKTNLKYLWDKKVLRIKTINKKILKNHKCDVNCKDQIQKKNKTLNLKFWVLKFSRTLNLKFIF